MEEEREGQTDGEETRLALEREREGSKVPTEWGSEFRLRSRGGEGETNHEGLRREQARGRAVISSGGSSGTSPRAFLLVLHILLSRARE